ncbi:N-acetylglucosamine-6-phosphate deacetylase [Vibrio gelatinilyticus]
MRKAIAAQQIFDGERFHQDSMLVFENGTIIDLVRQIDLTDENIEVTYFNDAIITPAFIDIQVNGGGGVMFNDNQSPSAIETILRAHRKNGTGYVLPTLISSVPEKMFSALQGVHQALAEHSPGLLGIHLEGPWLSPEKKGAHDPNTFFDPSLDELIHYPWLVQGKTLVTLAPEQVNQSALEWLNEHEIILFAGHSNASEKDFTNKLDHISGFTHLYNAMSPQTGRELGVVGMALRHNDKWVSFIADGHHVHPSNIVMAAQLKPKNKMVLVTDAMGSVGSQDGCFVLDGEKICEVDGVLINKNGDLAGAHITMTQSVANLLEWGIEKSHAFQMASTNAALALNLGDELGYLKPGYRASATILDQDTHCQAILLEGVIYNS